MNVQWRRQARDGATATVLPSGVRRLSEARRGDRGVVISVSSQAVTGAGEDEREELERRLLEIGFVEGAAIEILHEGFIGRDPIAVRLDDMRVALRRREAQGVLIRLDAPIRTTLAE
jgi:ferrous iron transport protein A